MAVGGLFVEVGMMLVEGRMSGAASGPPKPGPHCPQLPPAAVSQSSHICNESNHLCARAEALRRHMSLLSENRVPMCIEFYLCADCVCGRSRAAVSQPASSDLLLEQWTVTFNKLNSHQTGGGNILVEGKSLLAAIRSQLHFSQLSAWYSRHGGAAVPPVCYRVTHPAPGPPPPFHRPPVEHVFPTVRVHPNDFLKVSMKALPRLDSIPAVLCVIHGTCRAASTATPDKVSVESPVTCSPPLISSPRFVTCTRLRPSANNSRDINSRPRIGVRVCLEASTASHSAAPSPRSGGSRPPPPANNTSPSIAAPTATQAAQATITAFRTVFAELGHCLLDPPSRIPPLKQGFLAWRERRSQVVSSQSQNRSAVPQNVTNASSTSRKQPSIGMVDDRMQCGCKHIGKHHCEEPLDTDQESNNQISTNINQVCDNKERRKSSCSPPPPLSSNDLNSTRQHNTSLLHHCGSCREKELNKANARHGRSCGAMPLDGCTTTGRDGCATGRDGCAAGRGEICTSSGVPTTPPQIIFTPACQTQPNPLKRKRQQETSNSKKLLSERQSNLHQAFNSQQLVDIFRRLDIKSTDHLTRGNLDIIKTVDEPTVTSPASQSSSPLTCSPLTCSPLTISPLTPSPLATSPLLSSPSPNKKSGWTDSSSDDTENESPSRHTIPVKETKACSAPICSVPLPSRGLHPSLAKHRKSPSGPLLGGLEECLLKRRLRPDRIVTQGYTADLGASGSFCPKHLTLPVTMEFYPPMGLSTPLLGSTVVGKKGYSVPRSGTIQATLLNPHGNVVKMFVVPYQLEDMPANSMTFLRQRITCATQETACPLLRYLIHLRFSSSKSGRIYLEGEISMLVCRQYDADATLGLDPLDSNSHLTSVIVSPHNPKYSSRK